jgi:CRISPR system Cascade subunit CasB
MRLRYFSEAQGRLVRVWWNQLHPDEGARQQSLPARDGLGRADSAKLRRAASIEDLETERAAQLLMARLLGEPWRNPAVQRWCENDAGPLLAIAGVLAAVKHDARDDRSLVWRLGHAAGGESPPMSELRFKRLLKSRNLDEFFTAARRAVALAKDTADVAVLADDMLAWAYEQAMGRRVERPVQSLCFRWAQDYYQPQRGKDVDLAADEKTDEETEEGEKA